MDPTTDSIFISYRREDAAAYAGRLCDHLTAIAGADRVFMDVDDIAPGQNFAEAIDRSIAACKTVLIVIGPRWNQILTERSKKSEPDYVAHEVSAALANGQINVVPVLVGGAAMPRHADLPAAISSLALREAAELRDSTFKEDCDRLAKGLGLSTAPKSKSRRWWPALAVAAAVLVALFGLWSFWPHKAPPADPRLATAQTQIGLGEYESAFRTYQAILKNGPADPSVLDLQADAAMAWLRDFHVLVPEGQKAENLAGPSLAEITGVLESALARTGGHGPRAADILAHLGWAHWLNQHIAYKEFGPAAERNLRQALTLDPNNVFANAMFGNWLLQTHGDTTDALRHFEAAEKTNQQRPLVREMELGGMIYDDDPGIPAAIMRIVNQMRTHGEPIPEHYRSRVLGYFRPGNRNQVGEMLSAVPPEDAWATFLWLDRPTPGETHEDYRRELIHARVLELEGKKAEALTLLTDAERKMQAANLYGSLLNDVSTTAKHLRAVGAAPAPAR